MYEALCEEAMEEAEKNDEEPPFNLLLLDDCGNTIRSNPELERRFNQIVDNRRHNSNTSIIMILQNSRQIPPKIRSNLSHFCSFLPKSQ
mmetsp:Transcript_4021/g.5307  ORF Transcript_4021/g.5307 Transcript_4021/m.5307 type:complete len:89 (-) Transcript_4021:517-783(-)